ncbi:hypothetical protein BDQ17DRAFT_1331277 [Cyathus striatus]|nr:hypothetical protein BDQ17DRAFT_1331277 [Cyathus striatus]
MAHCSTCSATTQASSITPTESAPQLHMTVTASLATQPPTKKQAKANESITDNEETEKVQEKQGKKIVKGKKVKKTQKTSEMKRAEDAAADEEVLKGCWRKAAFLLPLQSGVHLLMYLNQQLLSSLLPLKKNRNLMDMKPITKVKIKQILKVQVMDQVITSFKPNKKHTEDQISKGKGSDKSNDNHTEDSTSKNKEGDIIMTSLPVAFFEEMHLGITQMPLTFTVLLKALLLVQLRGGFDSADCCLYVYKSKAWNILGNFKSAVKDDEEVDCLRIDGKHILPILSSGFMPNAPLSLDIETSSIQSKSAGSSAASSHAVSHSHTPSLIQRGGISEQRTEKLVEVLKISRDILESTSPGLRVAYQRYLACIKAVSDHNIMDKNRTWPIAKATKKEIVTVFVSSSACLSWLKMRIVLLIWIFGALKWLKEKEKGGRERKGRERERERKERARRRREEEMRNLMRKKRSLVQKVQSNFGSNITLSATLVILFSMIDNVDLLSLHARQQNAKLTGEKNVDATAWIRLLARAIQEKIGMDSDDLFEDYEINEHTTQTGRSILLGTKLDEMARLLKLYPFNQERKVFEGQLKPLQSVRHRAVKDEHYMCIPKLEMYLKQH